MNSRISSGLVVARKSRCLLTYVQWAQPTLMIGSPSYQMRWCSMHPPLDGGRIGTSATLLSACHFYCDFTVYSTEHPSDIGRAE